LAFVHVNELLVLFLAGLAVALGTRSSTGALLSKFRSGWVGAISFAPVAQGVTAAATAFRTVAFRWFGGEDS
jgi:hypothetical protein